MSPDSFASESPKSALFFRSPGNRDHFVEIADMFPQVEWADISMPADLLGEGTTRDELAHLHSELRRLKSEQDSYDFVVYSRAYGALTLEARNDLSELFSATTITAPGAALESFGVLNRNHLHVVTPYTQQRHKTECAWLENNGFHIDSSAFLGYPIDPGIRDITAEQLAGAVPELSADQVVYVACTMLPMQSLILGTAGVEVPVVTATQSLVSSVARFLGAEAPTE